MPRPWVAIAADMRSNAKMAELPSDTARYGWIVALGQAKLLRGRGTFTPGQWTELMGRFSRYRTRYIDAGLLHVAPDYCESVDRCLRGRGPYPDGTLVIHDWPEHQREIVEPGTGPQSGRERTANWRMRKAIFERDQYTCRYCGRDDYPRDLLILEHIIPSDRPESTNTPENLVTACRGCNHKKGGRTPEEAGMQLLPEPSGDSSHALVTRHSDTSHERHSDDSTRALSRVPVNGLSEGGGSGGRDDEHALQRLAEDLTGQPYVLVNLGSRLGEMARRQLKARGLETVTRTWRQVAEAAGPSPTIRQIVLGADDVLFPVPRMGPRDADEAEKEQARRAFTAGGQR